MTMRGTRDHDAVERVITMAWRTPPPCGSSLGQATERDASFCDQRLSSTSLSGRIDARAVAFNPAARRAGAEGHDTAGRMTSRWASVVVPMIMAAGKGPLTRWSFRRERRRS